MDVKIELIPIIVIIVIIPVLMFLAVNNDTESQKETSTQETDMMLKTISSYAEKGFDEICINNGNFTFCALEQKNWHVFRNGSLKELNMIKFEIATDGKISIPKNMIESAEIMGNYTSYYNECATTIIIKNNAIISQNDNCSPSNHISLDKLTKHVSINEKTFILSAVPLYEMPLTDDFGLNYFLEAKKIFEELIKTISS